MIAVAASEAPHHWLEIIPGFDSIAKALSGAFGKGFIDTNRDATVWHVFLSVLVIGIVALLAVRARNHFAARADGKLTVRTFFELVLDSLMGMMEGMMGRRNAERFLPLIGSLALFIFFSNALAMVPGMVPPTDNLNVTAALGLIVFVTTHVVGIKEQGVGHYIAHFFGPVIKWYALPLMILMFLIEIIGHLARPLSLSLRLMGNMFGDHAVLAIFLGIFPFFLPIPNMLLGTVVIIVQTMVFCILSIVYISLALPHEDEGAGAH